MQFQRTIAVAVACVLITGCALVGSRRPLLGYKDKNHPTSDTALIVCAEQEPSYLCGITGVDEQTTWTKYDAGKTPWVRVLPGDRVIRLTLSNNHLINRPWMKINGVQAGHVYRITADFDGKAVTAKYEDLGKMDSYTIHIRRLPLNPKPVTAYF
jgi:hypothetical protein